MKKILILLLCLVMLSPAYAKQKDKGQKHKKLPPGLAKNLQRGKDLPPALCVNIDETQRGEGLSEFELYTPKGYKTLRNEGIDAVLTAKTVDVDGTPESASVRVTDTANGNILAGITWQNAWGGMRGSMADRTMRKNLSGAAQDIAKELSNRLRRQN